MERTEINVTTGEKKVIKLTPEEIAEVQAQQIQLEEQSYFYKRAAEYPPIQEQLDMQYWDKINGTNNWEQSIQAVKEKYPKPE